MEKKTAKTAKATKTTKVTKPLEKPFEITDRVVFDALSKTVWAEEDRPDLDSMTESEISEELKESLQLLAPEDKAAIEAMDHGKEIWSKICDMRKDLAAEKIAAATAVKEKKPKTPPKPKAATTKTGFSSVLREFLIPLINGKNTNKDLRNKAFERFPDGNKSTIQTFISDISNPEIYKLGFPVSKDAEGRLYKD